MKKMLVLSLFLSMLLPLSVSSEEENNQTIPVLLMDDIAKSVNFYSNVLE